MKARWIQKPESAGCSIFPGLFSPILFLSLLVLGFPNSARATPGDLDPSFGTGGKVTTAVGLVDDSAYAAALQPDGKIVAAGYTNNGTRNIFALVRYNTDGSLDASFGTGGKVSTSFGTVGDKAFALVIQSDGKLVAGGYTGVGTQRRFALARYNTNGTLDSSFGTGGKVTTIVGTYDVIFSLKIQPLDGKIVAGGYSFQGTQYEFALARYNTNGTLDTGFGTGGKVLTQIAATAAGNDDEINGIVIQPDGKIVAAGYTYDDSLIQYQIALVRYFTDGSIDTTFGTGGIVITQIDIAGQDDIASSLAIQPDGKLVVAGHSFSDSLSQYVFAVVRYSTTGALDSTFGTGGIVTTAVGDSDEAFSVGIQIDGQIVAAGYSYQNTLGQYAFALARYNPDGTPDMSFGTGGMVITTIGTSDDEAYAMLIQPDRKLVAVGYSFDDAANQYEFAAVRYLSGLTIIIPPGALLCSADYNGTCAFVLNPLTIESGDSVVWSNTDGASHTATSDDHLDNLTLTQPVAPANSFSTGLMSGGTFSDSIGPFVNTTGIAQTKLYHCSVHPNMEGTLIILSEAVATTTTTTTVATTTTTRPTTTTTTSTTTTTLPGFNISGFTPNKGIVGTIVTISGKGFTGATDVQFYGTSAVFDILSSTRIRAIVPTGACPGPGTGPISVTTPSGTVISAKSFTCAATLTSFTPNKGPAGTIVTINGTGFAGAPAVQFNTIPATSYTVLSPTRIQATVPAGACPATGTIAVSTDSGTVTSLKSFTCAATLTSFTPNKGPAGTIVTINGTGFTDTSTVQFNGTSATPVTFLSSTRIQAPVPAGACPATGTIAVSTDSGTVTSLKSFTCAATLTSFTPNKGPAGTIVTINGTGFTDTSTVQFNGTSATPVTFLSSTRIQAPVPAGACPGPGTISVVTPSGTVDSTPKSFTCAATISSFTPGKGPAGTIVTINGTGFMGTTDVQFNGTSSATTPTVLSATRIQATVPAGATTGLISVITPSGTVTSTRNFTIPTTVATTTTTTVATTTTTTVATTTSTVATTTTTVATTTTTVANTTTTGATTTTTSTVATTTSTVATTTTTVATTTTTSTTTITTTSTTTSTGEITSTTTTTSSSSTTTSTIVVQHGFNVDMGKMAPPCGGSGNSDIGFVDCTSGTGGILVTAMTTISVGDTVTWTMRSNPHTVTSQTALDTGAAAPCGTGDVFDSGVANAFTPGIVFTHTFNTPGTCAYYCSIHPTVMQGQVNVL